MSTRRFKQLDVFTQVAFRGNPLAVILDAEGLSDAEMQTIARWTNLSETTFVLPPSAPEADYHVRIFTPVHELPFAGHPTLGTAHALLEAGLQPKSAEQIVQQCGAGLVPIRREAAGGLAFRAPPATFQPLADEHLPLLSRMLKGQPVDDLHTPTLVRAGIGWLVIRLPSADDCLAAELDIAALTELKATVGAEGIALYGRQADDDVADYEVRALFPEHGVLVEDPVTGSANACIARLLQHLDFPDGGATSAGYRARQGTRLQRDGRVQVSYRDGEPWIGGHSLTIIDGTLT